MDPRTALVLAAASIMRDMVRAGLDPSGRMADWLAAYDSVPAGQLTGSEPPP